MAFVSLQQLGNRTGRATTPARPHAYMHAYMQASGLYFPLKTAISGVYEFVREEAVTKAMKNAQHTSPGVHLANALTHANLWSHSVLQDNARTTESLRSINSSFDMFWRPKFAPSTP